LIPAFPTSGLIPAVELVRPLMPEGPVRLAYQPPAVLFSHNKSAISNQPTVLFSQNEPAPAISHQPTEHCHSCAKLAEFFMIG
jgi:hypothetical protein